MSSNAPVVAPSSAAVVIPKSVSISFSFFPCVEISVLAWPSNVSCQLVPNPSMSWLPSVP